MRWFTVTVIDIIHDDRYLRVAVWSFLIEWPNDHINHSH